MLELFGSGDATSHGSHLHSCLPSNITSSFFMLFNVAFVHSHEKTKIEGDIGYVH